MLSSLLNLLLVNSRISSKLRCKILSRFSGRGLINPKNLAKILNLAHLARISPNNSSNLNRLVLTNLSFQMFPRVVNLWEAETILPKIHLQFRDPTETALNLNSKDLWLQGSKAVPILCNPKTRWVAAWDPIQVEHKLWISPKTPTSTEPRLRMLQAQQAQEDPCKGVTWCRILNNNTKWTHFSNSNNRCRRVQGSSRSKWRTKLGEARVKVPNLSLWVKMVKKWPCRFQASSQLHSSICSNRSRLKTISSTWDKWAAILQALPNRWWLMKQPNETTCSMGQANWAQRQNHSDPKIFSQEPRFLRWTKDKRSKSRSRPLLYSNRK